RRLLFIATLFAAACGSDVRSTPPSAADRFPRLTHAQWEATVQDLFHLPAPSGLSASFTPDPQLGRFDNNIARLTTTSGLWRDYQTAAETLADRVVITPELYAQLVPDPANADARELITTFGLHAFRRPLKDAEVERYLELFNSAAAVYPQYDAFKAGVRQTIAGMLQSPFFLYRPELSTTKIGIGIPLDGYEVASRLSYLFWNSMPDDELLAAAKAGKLLDADGVREEANRLFDSPRAQEQFRRFHFQAFKVSQYADLDKNTTTFPLWRKEIGGMMQEEALRFLDSVVTHDGGVAELLTSTKAYVNNDLARIYGVRGTFGDDYQEVDLDPNERAGLLTRAGFLAKNATLTETDPIHRGVFINLDIICRQISAPPNIPTNLMKTGNTTREKVDSVTGEGTCGENCHHTIINPIGFAFENYDAIGQYRLQDNGYPVNAADHYTFLDGREISYTNAIDLSKQLAVSPEVHACYAQQLLEFMLGRDLQQVDKVIVSDLAKESLDDKLSIKEMVLSVVSSNTFRVRAVDVQPRSQP
ncbi:MAG TPA: DUF1592 domain-containing protein, partial [Kofleriaceae bacterium]|nr:DUF1592 domain-containing protein [Kofleriaceae bacterium]